MGNEFFMVKYFALKIQEMKKKKKKKRGQTRANSWLAVNAFQFLRGFDLQTLLWAPSVVPIPVAH